MARADRGTARSVAEHCYSTPDLPPAMLTPPSLTVDRLGEQRLRLRHESVKCARGAGAAIRAGLYPGIQYVKTWIADAGRRQQLACCEEVSLIAEDLLPVEFLVPCPGVMAIGDSRSPSRPRAALTTSNVASGAVSYIDRCRSQSSMSSSIGRAS